MSCANSSATVKTPDAKPTGISKPMGSAPAPTGSLNNFGFSAMPPADPNDLTDSLLRQKRAARATMLLSGQGRASTMGGSGSSLATALGSPQLGKSMLGG